MTMTPELQQKYFEISPRLQALVYKACVDTDGRGRGYVCILPKKYKYVILESSAS